MLKELFSDIKVFDIDPAKLRSKNFYEDFIVKEREAFWETRKVLNKPFDEAVCFLCGCTDGHTLFLQYDCYSLMRCPNCDLIFANVYVDDTYHKLVYDNTDYSESIEREIIDTFEYRKHTFGKERLEYIVEKCAFDVTQHKLLDIGCGPGYLLKYLSEKNVRCKGLEVTDYLVKFCRKNKLDVDSHSLAEETDQYNVITMFDVLEHLADPVSLFSEARERLEDNGYLLAYTPNILSFSFQLQEEKQNLLLPYEHLCFYSNRSLQYLAKMSGFELVSIEYYGLDLVDYLSMKEYEDGVSYNDKLKQVIPYLQALIDKEGISNHMRVVLKAV